MQTFIFNLSAQAMTPQGLIRFISFRLGLFTTKISTLIRLGYTINTRSFETIFDPNMKKTFLTSDPQTQYCFEHSIALHPAQEKLIEETMRYPGSRMMGSSDIMQLCSNLLKLIKAKKVLDVGVYTGNSTLTWALALPTGGQVISMDVSDEAYNSVGKKYVEQAGVSQKVNLYIQPAATTLDQLIQNGSTGTFDFAFIDADKENYINYYEKCLTLLRSGGILAVDNALWGGSVLREPKSYDTQIIDNLNKLIVKDSRVTSTLLPIGDGLNLVFKK